VRIRHIVAAVMAGVVTISVAPAAVAAPSASIKVSQSGTSATVTWNYKDANPTSQTLVVAKVVDPAVTVDPLDALLAEPVTYSLKRTARSQKVTDLQPGSKYTFTLRSKKPTLKVTRTVEIVAKPLKVTDVRLSWSGDELLVTWDYEGPAVRDWQISSAGSDNKEPVSRKTGSTANTARLKGLDKALGYTVTVRGINAAGTGPYADQTILQVAPNRPTNLLVRPLSIDGTKVAVTWEYDGPAVSGYRLQIRAAGYARNLDTLSAVSTAREIEIDGLTTGGTYVFALTARNVEASASSTTDPYQVAKVLAAPTNLTTGPLNNGVSLRWVAPVAESTNPITGYRIEYSDDAGTTWRSFLAQGTAVTYNVTGLSNGNSYRFRVAGLTAKGAGLVSPVATAVAGQVPAAPSNVKVVGATRQITVTWTAPQVAAGTITGYKIEYKRASETTWVPAPDVTTATATITGLEGGVSYNVRVAAVGESGQGVFSTAATGTAIDVPAAPVLTVTPGNRKADLRWTVPATNGSAITGYRIDQQTGDGIWASITTNPVTTTTFSVANLLPGTTYRFRVYAVNAAGNGAESEPKPATIVSAPDAPVVTATAAAGQVALTWSEPTVNGGVITAYKVERSTTGGSWSVLSENLTTTTYTATGLTNGTQYSFRVSARNATGWSNPSTAVAATPVTVPAAVTNVVIEPNIEEIKVRWSAVANTASATGGSAVTGYVVSYRPAAGSWSTTTVAGAVLQVEISDLIPGTTYEFKVAATNAAGTGTDSAVRTGVPYSAPQAPTNVSAIGKDREVTLSWSAPQQAVSAVVGASYKYKVEYTIDGSTWLPAKENITETTAAITGLTNGTPYRFRIAAGYTVGGKTSYGEISEVSATPRGAPGAPEGLRLQQLDATTVRLTWSAPSSTGGGLLGDYEISYSTNGTTWTPDPVTTELGLTVDVSGLTAGLPYTFRVRATNTFGESPYVTAELTPVRAPSTVTGLSVRQVANGQVSLGWNANVGAERVSGYRVEYSSGNNIWTLFDGAVTSTLTTVTGLTNGVSYTFRVSARNVAGYGTGATVTGIPSGPLPVSALTANAADGKVTLSWALPTGGGATVTGVKVVYSPDNGVTVITHATLGATATSTVVSSLANGVQHTFEVTVLTNLGDSAPALVRATPVTQLPSVVQNLAATPASTSVALDWDAPATAGVGSLRYKVEYKLIASSDWTTATSGLIDTAYTVSSLTASSDYEFRVTSSNAAGDGPTSTVAAQTTGA
jgi:hypothetical protein